MSASTRAATTIQPGDGDPRHGTPNGYNNLGCRCPDCTRAIREYIVPRNRDWRHRSGRHRPKADYLASVEAPHGTESRYKRCKCDLCREAARVARARRRSTNASRRTEKGDPQP